MDIEVAKNLCIEHDMLSKTVDLIEEAAKENYWVAIKTPRGESSLSNIQIRVVLEEARMRLDEIERTIKK